MPDELFLPNVLDVDTLRDLAARQVPITILDVRTSAELAAQRSTALARAA